MGFGLGTAIGTIGGGALGFAVGGPVGAMAGASLGAGIGGMLDQDDPEKATAVTPNQQYQYGLYTEGYGKRAEEAQKRDAYEMDFSQANSDYGMSLEAREKQMNLAAQWEAYLKGDKDSLAQLQLKAQADEVNKRNMQMAATGRGSAAYLGTREAIQQNALGQAGLSRDMAMLRAQEEAVARQQLGALYGQIRGMDLDTRTGSQRQTGMYAQNEQFQRQLNDQYALAQYGMQQHAADQQLAAEMGYGSQTMQGQLAAQSINAGQDATKRQQQTNLYGGLISGGAQGLGNAMGKQSDHAFQQQQQQNQFAHDDEMRKKYGTGSGNGNKPQPGSGMGGSTGGYGGPWLCRMTATV